MQFTNEVVSFFKEQGIEAQAQKLSSGFHSPIKVMLDIPKDMECHAVFGNVKEKKGLSRLVRQEVEDLFLVQSFKVKGDNAEAIIVQKNMLELIIKNARKVAHEFETQLLANKLDFIDEHEESLVDDAIGELYIISDIVEQLHYQNVSPSTHLITELPECVVIAGDALDIFGSSLSVDANESFEDFINLYGMLLDCVA